MNVKDIANVLIWTREDSSRKDIQKALFSVFMLEKFFEGNKEITDLYRELNQSLKYLGKEENSSNIRSIDRAVLNLAKLHSQILLNLVIPETVEGMSLEEMEKELEFLEKRKEEMDHKLSEEGSLSEKEFEEFIARILCLGLAAERKINILTRFFLDFKRERNEKYNLHQFRMIGGILLSYGRILGKAPQTFEEESRVNLISSARQFIESLKQGTNLNSSMNEMASVMEEVRRGLRDDLH